MYCKAGTGNAPKCRADFRDRRRCHLDFMRQRYDVDHRRRGGTILDYAERFRQARAAGEQVIIDGNCLSACTMVIGMLPRDRVCATLKRRARLSRRLSADVGWPQGRKHRRHAIHDEQIPSRAAQMDQPARRTDDADALSQRPRTCVICADMWTHRQSLRDTIRHRRVTFSSDRPSARGDARCPERQRLRQECMGHVGVFLRR